MPQMQYFKKLPSFNTVAAGQTSALILPIGPTYKSIILKHTASGSAPNEATTTANLSRIRVKINGTTRHDISGANRNSLNKYYGLPFENGKLVIPFTRKWMKTKEGEENVALGTANLSSLSLEVDIAGTAVSPTLEAWAVIDPTPRNLGTIVEVQEINYSTATTSVDVPNFPTSNGDLVAMHLKNGNFTDLSLKINQTDVVQNAQEMGHYLTDQGRTLQSGFQHIESTAQGLWDNVWPLQSTFDVRVTGTLSAAGSVPIVLETLNQPISNR